MSKIVLKPGMLIGSNDSAIHFNSHLVFICIRVCRRNEARILMGLRPGGKSNRYFNEYVMLALDKNGLYTYFDMNDDLGLQVIDDVALNVIKSS